MSLSNYKNLGRIILLPLILGIVPISGYSQWVDPANGVVVEPSASMSQFMRYGNTPVSLYTGSIDVSVPVYAYEDHEFNVPISLKYAFSGQKPNDPAGSVGLGWVLNAGGCITRQINHLPDEAMATGNDNVYGFYEMCRNGWSVPNIISSTYPFWNTSDYFYPMGRENVEAEPDIFSFNFMGHSGKFIFWGENKIVVFETSGPKGNYIVEPTVAYAKITGFTIKTKDGYTYNFGGNENLNTANDITSYNYKFGTWLNKYNGPQVMWPLVSVTSPSGRKLTLEYDKPDEYVVTARPTSYLIDDEGNAGNPEKELKWVHFACLSEQTQKSLYLKRISLPSIFSVDFNYSGIRNRESYYDRQGTSLTKMTTERLLESIVVKDLSNNTVVRTVSLGHTEGRPNPVPVLTNVHISDIGYYSFNYWNKDDNSMANYWTPYKGTLGIDHWGYSNGADNRGYLSYFPTSSLDNNKETITSTQRNPNFKYALCGALQEIYYPTGGKTEFIYEPNDYSAALIKSGLQYGEPYLENYESNKTAGGIRIKQIIDCNYDPQKGRWTDTVRIRTYKYKGADGKSSGVLLRSPRYRSTQVPKTAIPNTYSIQRNFMGASDMLECIDTDYHIEYKTATETYRDGSYCEYDYSNYTMGSCADRPIFNFKTATSQWAPGGIVVNDPYRYFYMRPGSRKAARGKLLSKTVYQAKAKPTDADVPSYMEIYNYNTIVSSCWRIRMTRYYWYQQEIITESCLMNSSSKVNFFGDGSSMSINTDYKYDYNTDYVKEIKTYDATGKYTKQTIDYASGVGYVAGSPFPEKVHTQVMMPGETEYKTVEVKKYEYFGLKVTPTLVIPRLIKLWMTHLDTPKTYSSAVEQENDLILEQTFVPGASRFNQITGRDGTVTTYLYGSNGCNLLAVVRNVSYNDVSAALGNFATLNNYSLTTAQETALRNMPGAVVTTYSYTPLTGLASVTDPSGSKQTYAYDTFRRLAKIYTGGNLEQEFKYQLFN
ncbi:MAG: hypothetical protein U0M63_05830 [Alistipes onderdonkii]|nr:hypothetical protein [Alistipes onderdonkii]MEE0849172.1 hypothetical protein [Alistipes onderdonkii]